MVTSIRVFNLIEYSEANNREDVHQCIIESVSAFIQSLLRRQNWKSSGNLCNRCRSKLMGFFFPPSCAQCFFFYFFLFFLLGIIGGIDRCVERYVISLQKMGFKISRKIILTMKIVVHIHRYTYTDNLISLKFFFL